jgi:glutamyl-tRNA synthetase/glutamyl-Q tRNA(Asp) synthetase
MSMLTRFAPSPTGYLHLGHVVNALYVWGVAAARGARVLVRIEDHDRIRSRPQYEQALLEDLAWLGFWNPEAGFVRQSDESDAYERALAHLRRTAEVYVCDCSRKQVGGERYPGHCRDRGLEDRPGRGLRVAIAPGVETFDDLRLGRQDQSPASQCGDLLLRDRDGHWTYQFAVTVDDMRQGVTLVVRGMDLLSSTGRQLRLARMLGRADAPRFLHHPLILKRSGEKLSKAARDTGVRALRAAGLGADDVIGRAAAAVGLVPHGQRVRAQDAGKLF